MPLKAWSAKRERQYEHIKGSLEDSGTPKDKQEQLRRAVDAKKR